MSQDFDNTNRGVLFKNREKQSDKSPDYSGKLNVEGVEFFLDAWIKDGAKGRFMSVRVKAKTAPRKESPRARPNDERYRAGHPDDEAPF